MLYSEAISSQVSKSISWLMVAMMPSRKSFLMISAAGLPIFSESSLTEIISVVITAFSMTTGSGRRTGCCLPRLTLRLPNTPSSSQLRTSGPDSFWIAFLFFAFLSVS